MSYETRNIVRQSYDRPTINFGIEKTGSLFNRFVRAENLNYYKGFFGEKIFFKTLILIPIFSPESRFQLLSSLKYLRSFDNCLDFPVG